MPRIRISIRFVMMSIASIAVGYSAMIGFFRYLSYAAEAEMAADHSQLAIWNAVDGEPSPGYVAVARRHEAAARHHWQQMSPMLVMVGIVVVAAATRLIIAATPTTLRSRHDWFKRVEMWCNAAILVILPTSLVGIGIGMTIYAVILAGD